MMRGMAFAIVSVAALAAWIAVQYGWRPPLVPLWDSLAFLYFAFLCFISAFVGASGAIGALPLERLPQRWRAAPQVFAGVLAGSIIVGAIGLSPASSPHEIFALAWRWVGGGAAFGLALGAATAWETPAKGELSPNQKPAGPETTAIVLVIVLIIGAALLLWPRERADPKLNDLGRFSYGSHLLEAGVVSGPSDFTFGVLRITGHGATNALILEADEWGELNRLSLTAEHSPSAVWRRIGEVRDTQPSDPTRLEVWAGAGLRFVITSPHGPPVTFDLAPADFARFDLDLARVAEALRHKD